MQLTPRLFETEQLCNDSMEAFGGPFIEQARTYVLA